MHSEKVARETRIPHDIHIEPGDTRAWDQFYGQIRELYWEQDLPLDTVIQIFKSDYGFHATKKQWKSALERWDMFKNVKTDEMKAIVRVKDRRDFEGKATEFWVRDRLVPQVKIDRFKARVRRTGHTPAEATPLSVWYFTPQNGPSFEVSPSKPTYLSPLRALAANDSSSGGDTYMSQDIEDTVSRSIQDALFHPNSSPTSGISQELFDIHGRKLEEYEVKLDPRKSSTHDSDASQSQISFAALLSAVRRNNVEGIKEAIENGAQVNFRRADGTTALSLAVQLRHYPAVHALIDQGANCQLAVLDFVQRGDITGLMYLQSLGASLSSDVIGEPLLQQAAKFERLDMAQYLLSQGLDANEADSDGRAAIYYACERGHTPIVRILLNNATTQWFSDSTNGLLHLAALGNNSNTAELLLEHGYPIDAINTQGFTALNYAVMQGHLHMTEILLRNGAVVGHSLHRAAKQGDVHLLRLLVEKSDNINLLDSEGMAALDYAIDADNLHGVSILLSYGAETRRPWPQDRLGILHKAVTQCPPLIVTALVVYAGAPINEKDASGQTVLDHAVLAGNWQLVKLLVRLGADSSGYYHFDDLPINLYNEGDLWMTS